MVLNYRGCIPILGINTPDNVVTESPILDGKVLSA